MRIWVIVLCLLLTGCEGPVGPLRGMHVSRPQKVAPVRPATLCVGAVGDGRHGLRSGGQVGPPAAAPLVPLIDAVERQAPREGPRLLERKVRDVPCGEVLRPQPVREAVPAPVQVDVLRAGRDVLRPELGNVVSETAQRWTQPCSTRGFRTLSTGSSTRSCFPPTCTCRCRPASSHRISRGWPIGCESRFNITR